jgi:hypothetical protein
MQQPGLHDRHRDKNGEISRKHGNTLVGTLRRLYCPQFAAGEPETAKLQDVQKLDEPSLSALVHDHEHGHLESRIAQRA